MAGIERDRLIAAIAARLQIRLDKDDPAFVIVELNHIVLETLIHKASQSVPRPASPSAPAPSPDSRWIEEVASTVADRVARRFSSQFDALSAWQQRYEIHAKPRHVLQMTMPGWALALTYVVVLVCLAFELGYQSAPGPDIAPASKVRQPPPHPASQRGH